jgi:tetratricopeptide (TPR) repeat protein
MNSASDLVVEGPRATDGEIAVINLQSARRRSWSRFSDDPHRPGIAELIVEQELQVIQFLSDFNALDRLEALVGQLDRAGVAPMRTAFISAQVASTTHRFAEARDHLAQAVLHGAPPDAANRLSLSIDQACGSSLEVVLEARRQIAAESRSLQDLVPLGALLADLGDFDEADRTYSKALREYPDVSPFALAWVCFQLGVLWGEVVPEPQSKRAAQWYRKAIEYLPCYVKARVHLAETYLVCAQAGDAEVLLIPAIASGDPEVHWRLADVMSATGRLTEAEEQLLAARSGYEALLGKHLLAFADHGAEFYSESGNDPERAFELARVNAANRPTLRALEQAHATAIGAGERLAAAEILAVAEKQWKGTATFRHSPLCVS